MWVACLLLLAAVGLHAQPAPSLEDRVKAVFLFNFTQFVAWPEQAFPAAEAPLVIGVLGENPFGTYLREVVTGETMGSHPIVVEHYREGKDLKPCHILFVSAGNTHRLPEILQECQEKGILTVGDAPAFLAMGGMIRLYRQAGKIRLQINPERTRAAGLTLSAKLLRLADLSVP
ncbi:hypothetical protein GCM10027275_09980 [Rhabdobacter roseus]